MAKKEQGSVFFITVDQYEDDPATGQLMLVKPTMRVQIPYINDPQFQDKDGVFHAAVSRSLTPDQWNGLYEVRADADHRDRMVAVMAAVVKKYAGKILGPFDSAEEAIQAKHATRAQTPSEKVKSLSAKLVEQNAELEALKAKLAAIDKK